MLAFQTGFDKGDEERMGILDRTFQYGMELNAHAPGKLGQFDDIDQSRYGIDAYG